MSLRLQHQTEFSRYLGCNALVAKEASLWGSSDSKAENKMQSLKSIVAILNISGIAVHPTFIYKNKNEKRKQSFLTIRIFRSFWKNWGRISEKSMVKEKHFNLIW